MSFAVWDYRQDIRNVVVSPEIRSRFMQLMPGEIGPRHTHDVAHEAFLVLQGQADFEIDGEHRVLGPGQMCFAWAGQFHEVRNVGDEPMIMYLSVTPHLEPTHTQWDEQGQRLAPRFGTSTKPEDRPGTGEPLGVLLERHLAASAALAEAAVASARVQASAAEALRKAADAGDALSMKAAADAMAAQITETYKALSAMAIAWNQLAPRTMP